MEERIGPDTLLRWGGNGHLIVAFSSIMSSYSNTFEFYSLLSKRDATFLCLRDSKRNSFHSGFSGVSGSIEENVEFLRYLRYRTGASRMSFVGICSGGYAAIMHAVLANADDVLVANPRTYVDYEVGKKLNCGPRIPLQFEPIYQHYAQRGEPPRHLDLNKLFRTVDSAVGPVILHFSENLRMDRINAMNIAEFSPVHLVRQQSDTHTGLAPILRDRGVLDAHLDTPPDKLVETFCTTDQTDPHQNALRTA